MKDDYKTRQEANFKIIKRRDKVVFSKPKELNAYQMHNYERDGYLIVKNFFSNDDISSAKKRSEEIFNNSIGYIINKEPNTNMVRSALQVHLLSEFKNLINKKLINISKSILGGNVYLHQSRINYKHGKSANGWNWHSDFETWHAKDGMPRMRCLTAMAVIDDNTSDNGCISFVPKSHNSFISCPRVGNVNPDNEFSEQTEGVPSDSVIDKVKRKYKTDGIDAICNSGDLVLFDCNTLHYSGPNNTDNKRTNAYFVFNEIGNKLVSPFNGGNHRPEEMAHTRPLTIY